MEKAVKQGRELLVDHYQGTRGFTETLCQNLLIEDYGIQGMEDVSPPKWHLAHTSWFFEMFVLNPYAAFKATSPHFKTIFNSYYQGVGKPFPRHQRGFLSRPSVQEIYDYRKTIDQGILKLIQNSSKLVFEKINPLITLGIHHEQQHQELLMMDIKYNFSLNPLFPVYSPEKTSKKSLKKPIKNTFLNVREGLADIGHHGEHFCFDNETPRHRKFIEPFQLASRLTSNQEYLAFIKAGGYQIPQLWLMDGWNWAQTHQIQAPLYWEFQNSQWMHFTLHGLKPLNLNEPVSHISYFEADAFARWKGCRLPTEEEWEHAARQLNMQCSSSDKPRFHPEAGKAPLQYGELWEWTTSAYHPYPGYQPLTGTVGEYNGKFMNNQRVLRGASFLTDRKHVRLSYRNYYGPDKRWPFNGIRLAKDR